MSSLQPIDYLALKRWFMAAIKARPDSGRLPA
jgi:hypothetical protein